jgi:2,4-dienoyl-CoA reductase-like NADH-dependent reductase (Old Yellow Enzyme family)
LTEATAVLPEGRISPQDLGIWDDAHVDSLARITRFIHQQGSIAGIQLAHAGRKASTKRPSEGHGKAHENEGGWDKVVAPTSDRFSESYPQPQELTEEGIQEVVRAFRDAACRASKAGFRLVEIHAAHGYLLHQFLSPLSNKRSDRYGGPFDNRIRLVCEVVSAVRKVWPDDAPLFMRISATDWVDGGWDLEQSVELARKVKALGIDLIDCSSGGNVPHANIPVGPGYQTSFAEKIRREAGILTGAVGMITDPVQADHVIRSGQADVTILARELLREPYWALHAARELGQSFAWPVQYLRAAPHGSPTRTHADLPELQSCFEEQHGLPEDK